jgi:hypothetical protein
VHTAECGPGLHGLRLDDARLAGHLSVEFTWRNVREGWQDETFTVSLD